MAERFPWNSSTVGTVVALAGLIGVGIGYGLLPKSAPEVSGAAEAPTQDLSDASRGKRGEGARRDGRGKRDARASRDGRTRDGRGRPDSRGKRDQKRDASRRHESGFEGPIDLSPVPGEDWVEIHNPDRAYPGFTLDLYQRRVPILIDMSGRIVHYWPEVRAVGRARLTREGNLIFLGADDKVREVDWDGKLIREYKSDVVDRFPHHDLKKLDDGRLALLYRTKSEFMDDIVLLDKDAKVDWVWQAKDHLQADVPANPEEPKDLTHFNSIQMVPDNPHHRAGDKRFKAGNLLISSRNLNTLYMIDPDSGDVVWKYSKDLDWQHEAILLGDEFENAGNILFFNNRYHSKDQRSEVLELNPITNEIVWRYSAEGFFCDTAGSAEKLPNGNVLITSSRGARTFEVTPDGEVVWQWEPPFLPMRSHRYGPDYSPQLAALGAPSKKVVTRQESGPYIDEDLYDFKMSKDVHKVPVGRKKRDLLTRGSVCHDVQFPGKAMVTMEMGFLTPESGETSNLKGSIKMTVGPRDGGATETIFDRSVSFAQDGEWFRDRARIPKEWFYKKGRLCVESTAADIERDVGATPGLIVGVPKIVSGNRNSGKGLPSVKNKNNARAEAELQKRQLEALGYIE